MQKGIHVVKVPPRRNKLYIILWLKKAIQKERDFCSGDRPHFGDSSSLGAAAAQSFLCQPDTRNELDDDTDGEKYDDDNYDDGNYDDEKYDDDNYDDDNYDDENYDDENYDED